MAKGVEEVIKRLSKKKKPKKEEVIEEEPEEEEEIETPSIPIKKAKKPLTTPENVPEMPSDEEMQVIQQIELLQNDGRYRLALLHAIQDIVKILRGENDE